MGDDRVKKVTNVEKAGMWGREKWKIKRTILRE